MSDHGRWCVATDGSLLIGEHLSGLEYHPKLNVLMVTSKESGILVYDAISCSLIKKTGLSASHVPNVWCKYISDKNRLLFGDGTVIGCRTDLKGMFLLDAALRTKANSENDVIQLEIPLSDAEALVNGVDSVEMMRVEHMDDILQDIRVAAQQIKESSNDNQKKIQWSTILLERPQYVLLNVFQHIMMSLKNKQDANLALPVAASLTERSGYYAKDFDISAPVPEDRTLMYSEAARLATFRDWPHMNYKWAVPENMSRAGFYYEANTANADRSMCFTCNVCLVCWDETDEPWSEHERHQPNCPFVKGMPTQNVPLSVYYATQPAIAQNHTMTAHGRCGDDTYIAALEPSGDLLNIWLLGRKLDLYRKLRVTKPEDLSSQNTPTSGDVTVTAMCLHGEDNEQSELSLIAGLRIGDRASLVVYQTGCNGKKKPEISSSMSNEYETHPEEIVQPILPSSAQSSGYLVLEPQTNADDKATVVPIDAKCIQHVIVPDGYSFPGFEVTIIEPTLDKSGLLVYLRNNETSIVGMAGVLLLFKIRVLHGVVHVEAEPCQSCTISSADDGIVHINQLCLEFSSTRETEGDDQEIYHMLVTTAGGSLKLMTVSDLKEVVTYSGEHHLNKSIYCSGIDRVCATTNKGDIILLQVNPVMPSFTPTTTDFTDNPSSPPFAGVSNEVYEFLDQPTSSQQLSKLIELTECENLRGKFTATLPPCWVEVQQEQQQRKHPQHLHQVATETNATFITRTWKLQTDAGTGNCDHMMELSLPKMCCIGHVDIRFKLRGTATEIPNVKVALLYFKMDGKGKGKKGFMGSRLNDSSFLPQSFLDKHNLELLCNPIDISTCSDVTGQSGIVTLTSSALLAIKPRSLVIFMKHMPPSKPSMMTRGPVYQSQLEQQLFPHVKAPPHVGLIENPNRSSKSYKGVDKIEEISISVRKTKKTDIARETLKRMALLDHKPLHYNLAELATSGEVLQEEGFLIQYEQSRVTAMRLLSWIASVQMNDVKPRNYTNSILQVIEDCLPSLIKGCFIKGTRTTGHALMRLLVMCTELSRRLSKADDVTRFSKAILGALLDSMNVNDLLTCQSAGAMQSFFVILSRVKCLDSEDTSTKLTHLLQEFSWMYADTFTDSDLSLLVKYGFDSSPYDNDIFDATLPAFIRKSPFIPGSTYASAATSNKQVQQDSVPDCVDLMNSQSQGLTIGEQLTARTVGLLEVEPLQYSINSYSEYIHVTHGNNPNVTPVFYGSGSTNMPDPATLTYGMPINVPIAVGASLPHEHVQHLDKFLKVKAKELIAMKEGLKNPASVSMHKQMMQKIHHTLKAKSVNLKSMVGEKLPTDTPVSTSTGFSEAKPPSGSHVSKLSVGSLYPTFQPQKVIPIPVISHQEPVVAVNLSSSEESKVTSQQSVTMSSPFPSIQAILQPPSEFTLIAGRMSSGNARRYIVLDFGQPIRLTDVMIPACGDLSSLCIEVWVKGETIDTQRLIVCSDIGQRSLVLTDIQPACVCRYLKITYASKASGSAGQTFRVPLGVFYGYCYVFPWETTPDIVALRTQEDVYRQIGVYFSAAEDIRCCYKLACGRLKSLIQSAELEGCNTDGLTVDTSSELSQQIHQTYDECVKLQQQLNLANQAVRRLRSVLPKTHHLAARSQRSQMCRDKLRFLVEGLLSALISNPSKPPKAVYTSLSADCAKQLFINLCLHGNRHIQLLTGNLLVRVCSGQLWYGHMFGNILVHLFSSNASRSFPKLKVFTLLVSMAHRSLSSGRRASNRVCGHVLELLANQLAPISVGTNQTTGFVDVELVSWLLLFLSRLLDSNFVTPEGEDQGILLNRWDFLLGEDAICKRKVYHRYTARQRMKQERSSSNLKKRFGPGRGARMSLQSERMRRQLMRSRDKEMMKMRRLDMDPNPRRRHRMLEVLEADLMLGGMVEDKVSNTTEVTFDPATALPVVRGLIGLLLNSKFSCHSDLFILASKVLGRLSLCARPTLKLGEIVTQDQLRQLIRNITHSQYNSKREVWGSSWVKHAVVCLLQDIVEGERVAPEVYPEQEVEETPSDDASSSQAGGRRRRSPHGLPPMYDPYESYGLHMEIMEAMDMQREMRDMMLPPMFEQDPMDLDMDMYGYMDDESGLLQQMMVKMTEIGYGGGNGPSLSRRSPVDGPPMAPNVTSHVSACIDSRLEYCSDAMAELRLQIWHSHELSNLQKVLKSCTNSSGGQTVSSAGFTAQSASPIPNVDNTAFTDNGNSAIMSTEELLSVCFSSLLAQETEKLDLESVLNLYLELTEEFRDDSKDSFDPACQPYIHLTTEAIKTLVTHIANSSDINNRTWTIIVRVLTILLNSNLSEEERTFALNLCGSESFQKLLLRFLKCGNSAGPTALQAFEDLLTRIDLVYQAANQQPALTEMLLSTLCKIASESATSNSPLFGALDAQCVLVDFLRRLPVAQLPHRNVVSLFESVVLLVHQMIDQQETVVPCVGEETDADIGLCFRGRTSSSLKKGEKAQPDASEARLVIKLLNLIRHIVKTSVSDRPSDAETDTGKLSRTDSGKLDSDNDEPMDTGEEVPAQRTDEQKSTDLDQVISSSSRQRCLHLMDVDALQTLADTMLSNRALIGKLIGCLANCHTDILNQGKSASSVADATIGDAVFHLILLLFRTATNYYQMLELLQIHLTNANVNALSQPLLYLVKFILNCEHTITRFIELGGVRCIADNLVQSFSSSLDNSSSMITSVLQQITNVPVSRSNSNNNTSKPHLKMADSNDELMMNFAPLGNIFSSNPSVGASFALIQANPAHRRARTAPWSYKFLPEQPWVDLIINLPCAVLIKEVQVHPYLSSIHSAGPSHIVIELSHDGLPTLPARQPVVTSGLTTIKVKFLKAEVASSVTLRIYKPRDSSSLGLSQICILGYPGLAEPGTVPQAVNASLTWLQLLYHCVNHVPSMSSTVLQSVATQEELMHTCTSLLLSHVCSTFRAHLEKVIIAIAVKSPTVGIALISRLLRQSYQGVLISQQKSTLANDSTSEILYRLGVHQDESTPRRIKAFLTWLKDVAACGLQTTEYTTRFTDPGVRHPSHLHIQCIAVTLWKCVTTTLTFDLKALLSQELFNSLFMWSVQLTINSSIKQAVDSVMAAFCHLNPDFFQTMLQRFYMTPLPLAEHAQILRASVTDDTKDDIQQEMLTDDTKEDCRFAEDVLTNETYLTMLATSVQSPECANTLIQSNLLRVLSQALAEFCLKQLQEFTDEQQEQQQAEAVCITWETLPSVLRFFSQCAVSHHTVKDWLGGPEGQIFWTPLLELFCAGSIPSSDEHGIESSVVSLFKCVTLNHKVNQHAFSDVLCAILRVLSLVSTGSGHSLTSFTKNLLLRVLLEDEKVNITVSAKKLNYSFSGGRPSPFSLKNGVGHSSKTVSMSVYSTCKELAEALTTKATVKSAENRSLTSSSSAAKLKMSSVYEGWGSGVSIPSGTYTGDEYEDMMVDQLAELNDLLSTTAAQAAKEKRDKSTSTNQNGDSPGSRKKTVASVRPIKFYHYRLPHKVLGDDLTLAELMVHLVERGFTEDIQHLELKVYGGSLADAVILDPIKDYGIRYSSTLKVFTSKGGLALLAEHLPLLYPEITQQSKQTSASDLSAAELTDQDFEFVTQVKGISLGEVQYELIPGCKKDTTKKTATGPTTIPPHSLVAFGLFLRLPGYAEMLLRQRLNAKCLLRLVLGVRDDGEGVPILASPVAKTLPTLPFTNLQLLYASSPLTTDDGLLLRRTSMEIGVLHLVLACLAVLSHHKPRKVQPIGTEHKDISMVATQMASQVIGNRKKRSRMTTTREEGGALQQQTYWAKGTGFGTGSTTAQWDLEQSLLKQKGEEEHVTCMLDILSALIYPEERLTSTSPQVSLPQGLVERLSDSCLIPAAAAYLRNDSVLDMSRHVPLYKALLRILRSLAANADLVPLLKEPVSSSDSSTMGQLLQNMATCVQTYNSRLKSNTKKTTPSSEKSEEEDQANSLAQLTDLLSSTNSMVKQAIDSVKDTDIPVSLPQTPNQTQLSASRLYEQTMKELQFDTFEMVEANSTSSTPKFIQPHHYEMQVKQSLSASNNAARMRRLAQEAVTLSTSLPLSASSSVFVRCDEERMDIMKVLITGPADTPYMNGCFELDVYFPADYPVSPPLINLQTTGNHKVRFNPNLYNDGKVCLSVLNTWHGRPEEKWNAQTSSFLQVLVSIQSLILVSEPYFNEPGYERSRGTPNGQANCREYDSNIRQATVKFAMLEMLKNPPACFKDIIHKHFWMKRKEIKEQLEVWLAEQDATEDLKSGAKAKTYHSIAHNNMLLRKVHQQLMAELQRMKPPAGFEETDMDISSPPLPAQAALEPGSTSTTPATSVTAEADIPLISNSVDIQMEQDEDWPNVNISETSSDMIDETMSMSGGDPLGFYMEPYSPDHESGMYL